MGWTVTGGCGEGEVATGGAAGASSAATVCGSGCDSDSGAVCVDLGASATCGAAAGAGSCLAGVRCDHTHAPVTTDPATTAIATIRPVFDIRIPPRQDDRAILLAVHDGNMKTAHQSRYCGIFSNSPSLSADWWATMPETVRFRAMPMSTSGLRF